MPKEDFYEKEIEKIAQFLQAVIRYHTKRESADEIRSVEAKREMKEKYQIDLENLHEKSTEEIVHIISDQAGFNYINMEYMADLIHLMAESETDKMITQDYLAKSLALYLHIDKMQRTYSAERAGKMKRIAKMMNQQSDSAPF